MAEPKRTVQLPGSISRSQVSCRCGRRWVRPKEYLLQLQTRKRIDASAQISRTGGSAASGKKYNSCSGWPNKKTWRTSGPAESAWTEKPCGTAKPGAIIYQLQHCVKLAPYGAYTSLPPSIALR